MYEASNSIIIMDLFGSVLGRVCRPFGASETLQTTYLTAFLLYFGLKGVHKSPSLHKLGVYPKPSLLSSHAVKAHQSVKHALYNL